MRFVQQHDDEALLAELRRVAKLEPSATLTQRVFNRHSSMASTLTLLRRFGSWRGALERAGLADRYSGQPVSPKMRRQRSRALTDDEILAELRRVSNAADRGYVIRKDVGRSDLIGFGVIYSRFGSFGAAAKAAGLTQSPLTNRWTDQDYLDNLRTVALHLGRTPILNDMNRPPSRISRDAYRHRFGSWAAALRAAELGHTA